MRTFLNFAARFCAVALATIAVSGPLLAQTKTAEIVSAADKFLATLSPEQRQKVLYAYDDAKQRARWSNFPTGFVQFSSLFHLGMRHIAEGTDHLLFLLTLLLPAPLLVSGRRWGQPADPRRSLLHILGIVSAFTIGHSITLTLAALNFLHVPSRPVEVLIAAYIFVSALHALRPIVPGKEAWIAGFFGLIHGLAFAATLDRLGLGHWDRVAGILAFNLGIEAMQMLVLAVVLPSLMLISRTSAYPVVRIGGAAFAGAASLGWMVERLINVETPVDRIVDSFARHAPSIAAILFLASLACRLLLAPHTQSTAQTNLQSGLSVTSGSGVADRY